MWRNLIKFGAVTCIVFGQLQGMNENGLFKVYYPNPNLFLTAILSDIATFLLAYGSVATQRDACVLGLTFFFK
jgi:hypothetical protein